MYSVCQLLLTGFDDIILHLSHHFSFTFVSCWCEACCAPLGDCLTLPSTLPPHHPLPVALSSFTLLPLSQQLAVLTTTSQNLQCEEVIITKKGGISPRHDEGGMYEFIMSLLFTYYVSKHIFLCQLGTDRRCKTIVKKFVILFDMLLFFFKLQSLCYCFYFWDFLDE